MNKILYSAPFRKTKALANRAPRAIARLTASPHDYQTRPPIIVNSLPKSGTHLLMQVAQALLETIQYGSFITQTPCLIKAIDPEQSHTPHKGGEK